MTTELPPRFEPPVSTHTEQPLPESITDFAGWRAWLGPRPMIAMNTFFNCGEVRYPQPGPANTAWLAHDLLNHAEAQAARIATLEAALRDADDELDNAGYRFDGPTRRAISAALAKQP